MKFLCVWHNCHIGSWKKSPETFHLIKITKEYNKKDYNDTDDYGHTMKKAKNM